MQKLQFLKTAFLAAGVCVLLCYTLSLAGTGNDTAGPDTELRRLGEKIDSLEVEKQVTKRNGQPIAELEAKTAVLRDSIKTLRLEIGQGTAPLPAAAPSEKGSARDYLKKLLPGPGIFDRVLLAAGGVTVIIGIFFLFFVLSLKSRRRKQDAARNQTKRVAAQYEDVRQPAKREVSAMQNAYPDSFANTASESAALASLIPPLPAPEGPPPTQSRIPVQQPGDLQDLVLKASSEGLDAKEISRRCHIGIDQVALILKMAKKQQR